MKEMSVEELKKRLSQGDDLFILDVRQPEEYEQSSIESSTLIPLDTLPSRAEELDKNRETVVHCKSGARSAKAIGFLTELGFKNLWNLVGGNDAWQAKFGMKDPS